MTTNYVLTIGAINIDYHGFSTDPLLAKESNPGRVKICMGGVGRNISENLARMGVNVKLLSAVGNDVHGHNVIDQCKKIGIDMGHVIISNNFPSASYIALMNNDGDMELALSDMEVLDNELSVQVLQNNKDLLENAEIIITDAGISIEVFEYLFKNYSHKKIFMDPVSIGKAKRLLGKVGNFDTIKFNTHEASFLSGMPINSITDASNAALFFMREGTRRVFITMGKDGVVYGENNKSYHLTSPSITVKNATGAGDAFVSGLVFAELANMDIHQAAVYGSASSAVALADEHTVSPKMSKEELEKAVKLVPVGKFKEIN